MELKLDLKNEGCSFKTDINRTRMELKLVPNQFFPSANIYINRTRMELKHRKYKKKPAK